MRNPFTIALVAALLPAVALAQPWSADAIRGQTSAERSGQATAQITVENRLGPSVVVFSLFVSSSDDHHWGPDRLGNFVLRPHTTIPITIQGDCRRQDVRIQVLHEDARGGGPTGEIVRRSLNVCSGLRLSPDLAWRLELPV